MHIRWALESPIPVLCLAAFLLMEHPKTISPHYQEDIWGDFLTGCDPRCVGTNLSRFGLSHEHFSNKVGHTA